ncbi:MAG: UDP-N-acetylglucosamine--N-acetylmuramyl-(pentapeptide) pyrophosphoryl-undecaprenol N-acetylglucosamine transferase [Terrimesophilobacter sp.]
MTRYLFAGGGTAGHVNPLLAVADHLRSGEPTAEVLVLGTDSGLEKRLVPERGYELLTVEKVPMPRRLSGDIVRFPLKFSRAVRDIRTMIRDRNIELLVGFGGFVSAPAYVAAWREKLPIVVHEANAVPGFANRVGSAFTRFVGVAFSGTKLRHARVVGMPLLKALEALEPASLRAEALAFFGLDPAKSVLLVTGGSLGARSINDVVSREIDSILDTGWSVLHIVGARSELRDKGQPNYRVVSYCDRMDLAFSAATLALARAGSATVSELTALGIPAVYVPLPIGNGEQLKNTTGVVGAGGALVVKNSDFTGEWVRNSLVPLLNEPAVVAQMAAATAPLGVRNGAARTVALVAEALKETKAAHG